MEEIARDPQAFIRSQGWTSVELDDSQDIRALRSLYEYLQVQILDLIEAIDTLKTGSDYELYLLEKKEAGIVDDVIDDQKEALEATLEALRSEAEQKRKEIEELTE
jgi:hypothetical protein